MTQILIIDDEESMRFIISSMLSLEGYQPLQATDGEMGLRICAAERPELVITDLVMPNKEGIETIIELRESFPELKIIAISGGGGLDPTTFLTAAKALGADHAIRKPFRSAELIEAVARLLEKGRCSARSPKPPPFEP